MISFEKSIKISSKKYYENILDAIKEEEEQGNIRIYRYPDRPNNVPLDNSDLIPKVVRWHKRGMKSVINRFLNIYPELEEKLEKSLAKENEQSR